MSSGIEGLDRHANAGNDDAFDAKLIDSPVKKHGRLDGNEQGTLVHASVDEMATIPTRSEFYTWYSELEATRASEAEAKYKKHVDKVEGHIESCNNMLKSIDTVIEIFDALKASQRTISGRTDALKDQCDTLVSDRENLLKVSEMVKVRLNHFDRLETLSSLFHAPVNASSDPHSILRGLADLDESLNFTSKHPEYLESSKYHAKFQNLQTRALSLVKSYFEESVSTAVAECKIAGKVISSDDADGNSIGSAEVTMQNVKFRAVAEPRLKELMTGVCRHGDSSSYVQLLKDCTSVYCKARFELIRYIIFSEIQKIRSDNGTVIEAIKRGSEVLSQTAEMEIQLYQQIFHGISLEQASLQLSSLFDSMCILLTAVIEPMIYSQIANDLHALSEVNAYMKNLTQNRSHGFIFNVPSLNKLIEGTEKLIFRQAKSECLDGIGVLNDPILLNEEGMQFMKTSKPPLIVSRCRDMSHCAIEFPPVSRVIVILNKLYPSVVNKEQFVEFIRDVVMDLLAVIESASEKCTESMGEAPGAIFKFRQLSLLMDCLNGFQDLEFGLIKSSHGKGFAQFGRQLSTKIPILSSLTNRSAQPRSMDVKAEVQKKLTMSREFCILTCSQDVINPLLSFLTKVTAAKVEKIPNEIGSRDIKSHAFASVERLSDLSQAVRDAIQGPLSRNVALLHMTIPEKDLESVLTVIWDNLDDAIKQVEGIIHDEYTDDERHTIAFPSVDDVRNHIVRSDVQ